MSDLYGRIEKLCREKGVNITIMCKESGASRGSLTDLKKGRNQNLSAETLAKIADYFSVPVDYLMGNEEIAAGLFASGSKYAVKKEDILFALSRGGEKEITDEMYEEILSFADYVIQREEKKKKAGEFFPL